MKKRIKSTFDRWMDSAKFREAFHKEYEELLLLELKHQTKHEKLLFTKLKSQIKETKKMKHLLLWVLVISAIVIGGYVGILLM